jgi:hypothetical protein
LLLPEKTSTEKDILPMEGNCKDMQTRFFLPKNVFSTAAAVQCNAMQGYQGQGNS